MKKEPKYVAETLAWCNARRKEQGKKPVSKLPKGYMRDPESCPCGRACGLVVGLQTFGTHDESLAISWGLGGEILPRPVKQFVKAFDAGKLPQYMAK